MRFRYAILAVLILALSPCAAQAKTDSRLPALPPVFVIYDVYVGGFHLIQTRVWFEERDGKYQAVVKGQTRGIWARFFPWHTFLTVYGKIAGERLLPQEFYTRDEWYYKPKITKLHFDGKGGIGAEFDPPNTDQNREIVTDEQKKNALDPITGLLQMLVHVAVDKSCDIPVPIFDGKRRFDITGKDAGYENIEDEEYSSYKGNARLCTAEFNMISGDWKDKEHARFWQKSETEQGREPFHIWLGSPAPDLPEMPVRLESGSIVGLIVVHLATWRYASEDEIANEEKSPY